MPILILQSCIDVDLHSSVYSSSSYFVFSVLCLLITFEYIFYQALSYYVFSPRQCLFWYFLKVKQIPHWHQKLILNCIPWHDWLERWAALGLFSDWKSENHNLSPANTPSFLPHPPCNLPYQHHLQTCSHEKAVYNFLCLSGAGYENC